MEPNGPQLERKDPPDIDISKLVDQKPETAETDEELVKTFDEAFKEEENKPAGEWRVPKYEEMLREQENNIGLNKPVEKVKEGDFSSLESKKVVYGAAREGILKKQQEEFEAMKAEHNSKAGESEAEGEKGPQASEGYEKVRAEWKAARDRAHKLEAEFNEKYRAHIASQSMVWRGVRKAFGFQPRLSSELESLQRDSAIARGEYHAAGKRLAEARETKPMTKYSSITKTPGEFGGKEAVEKRYQRMLAYHLVTNVHKERLKTQREAIDQVWSDNKVLNTLDRHKKKIMFGTMVGATVLTGGTALAGIAAGAGVGIGTYKLLDKTWVQAARKKLASGSSEVGTDFFNKSFLEADQEMEYLVTDVETRQALSKTTSAVAGAAAGMTAMGMVSGENVSTPPSGVEEVTPVTPEPATPTTPETVTPAEPVEANPVTPETVQPNAQSKPVIEMGDLKVMEELQPKVDEAIAEIEAGHEESPAPVVPPEAEPAPELQPESANIHTVEKNDNVWNIMEGKGPDANPVGGKSEVLQGMSLSERQHWLDKLVEYYEQHPEEAIEVGAVKSNGNIHMIHPGEEINVSMLDDKLRELMGQNIEDVPAQQPEAPIEVPAIEETPELPEVMSAELPEHFNDLTIEQMLDLSTRALNNDAQALAQIEAYGHDGNTWRGLIDTLDLREGDVNNDMTIREYLKNSQQITESLPDTSMAKEVPEVTPFNNQVPMPGDMPVREASFTPEVANSNVAPSAEQLQQNLNNYVSGVEKPNVGFIEGLFMSTPKDVSGTFDQISNMNVQDMLAIDAQNSMPEGVSEDGWNRWVDNIKEMISTVPANDNEPIGQYVSRIVNSQAA